MYSVANAVRRKISDTQASKGGRLVIGNGTTIQPSTRICYNCCPEGNELPIELFITAPCCGHKMCCDCKRRERTRGEEMCGECLTPFPHGENRAVIWIMNLMNGEGNFGQRENRFFLLGRTYIRGQFTYVDEMECVPMYESLRQQATDAMHCALLQPDIEEGIRYLEVAAEMDSIPSMLYLADVYSEYFSFSPGSMDKKKAEYWYTRALGKGNTLFPLAFTRFGLFLLREGRFKEAKAVLRVAAEYNHAEGQVEYAKCLLNEAERERLSLWHYASSIVSKYDNQHASKMEAIKWLCKACQNGHYFPSYILLAKLLIEIAEKNNGGRADCVGRSPIPRAFQMLELAERHSGTFRRRSINDREKTLQEIQDILDQYEFTRTQCANCGQPNTEMNPLIACSTCRVVHYCSKLCLKRHYRDGHRIDCCSQRLLFRYDLIEKHFGYRVDDTHENGATGNVVDGDHDGQHDAGKTLSRLVEDVTDEVHFGEDEDYDSERLAQQMQKTRRNLEQYVAQFSDSVTDTANTKIPLRQRIKLLVDGNYISPELTSAMDMIRTLGNEAAHQLEVKSGRLDYKKCREAVLDFLTHIKTHDATRDVRETVKLIHEADGVGVVVAAPTDGINLATKTVSTIHSEVANTERAGTIRDTDNNATAAAPPPPPPPVSFDQPSNDLSNTYKECSICVVSRGKSDYSANQWKKRFGESRRCKQCLAQPTVKKTNGTSVK